MRSFFFFAIAMGTLLISCSRQQYIEFEEWSKVEHSELMQLELSTIGKYSSTQTFHQAMMLECYEQYEAPYPELKNLLDSMRVLKTGIQYRRGKMYEKHQTLIREKADIKELESAKENSKEYFEDTASDTLVFMTLHNSYHQIIADNEIRYVSHADYAVSLINRIMQWQDTLERQGSIIAKALRDLDAKGGEKNSPEYIQAYGPISEMQLLHKELQAHITGAENAHTRYASARPDDGFFYGPFLVERQDATVVEGVFDLMKENMTSFRNYLSTFQSSINR